MASVIVFPFIFWNRSLTKQVMKRTGDLKRSNELLEAEISERKQAEERLRRREAILQTVAYAAESFLKAPSWEDDLDLILARLGQAAEVSRVYVFENHTDAAGELLASQRYEWVAPGVTAQLDNPDMQRISWRSGAMRRAAEILGSGGFVSSHVRDLLPAEQEMMSAQDIQSMLVVPIFASGEWWGFMGFDECVRDREWSEAEIDALKAGVSTLGAAIHRKRSEEALKESAARLQLATSATRIGHWNWDIRTNEVYFSPEWKRHLGYEDHEIANRFEEWESRLHPDDRQRTIKALEDYIADRRADYAIEFRLRHKDASYRWIYTRADKQFDDTGNPYRLFGCHVDITERKQAEQALQKSEKRFRDIADNALEWIWEVDSNGKYTYVSPVVEKILGYKPEEILQKHFYDLFYPDNREELKQAAFEVFAGKKGFRGFINRNAHKNGKIVWLSTSAIPIVDERGELVGYRGADVDITERKQEEQRLKEYQQRLRSLAFQLTIIEEKERRSIAADLHDLIGHSLALARMQLEAVLSASSKIETTLLIKDISKILLKAIQNTKKLMFELSSPFINEIGLAAAISEWLEDQIGKQHNLKTEFVDESDDAFRKTLNPDMRALLFRNVRELLTNVVKHARANMVSVHLTNKGARVKIVVRDDGVGFDPDAETGKEKPARGFGLFSIQERMHDLGGTFDIQSAPGKGCRVVLTAPLGKENE